MLLMVPYPHATLAPANKCALLQIFCAIDIGMKVDKIHLWVHVIRAPNSFNIIFYTIT